MRYLFAFLLGLFHIGNGYTTIFDNFDQKKAYFRGRAVRQKKVAKTNV